MNVDSFVSIACVTNVDSFVSVACAMNVDTVFVQVACVMNVVSFVQVACVMNGDCFVLAKPSPHPLQFNVEEPVFSCRRISLLPATQRAERLRERERRLILTLC
jgi:hypothetical protein